jgi:3-phenylpropionate/cinnamic acid dioxygenase small subunit
LELWELIARESIRDLVARYNANGDSGRFEEMLKVFADDASMELVAVDGTVRRYDGVRQVATIFTDTKATWDTSLGSRPDRRSGAGGGESGGGGTTPRHHIRHFTSTHQIDLVDESHARGRCYFAVLMPHGLDHWGRYVDEYGVRDGRWVITLRRAFSDGRVDRSPTG